MKSIKGRIMRLTALDECGAPLYDSAVGKIVTTGFISVSWEHEVEDGTEHTSQNAWGDFEINELDAPRTKWLNLGMDMCEVDPETLVMLGGAVGNFDTDGMVGAFFDDHAFSTPVFVRAGLVNDSPGSFDLNAAERVDHADEPVECDQGVVVDWYPEDLAEGGLDRVDGWVAGSGEGFRVAFGSVVQMRDQIGKAVAVPDSHPFRQRCVGEIAWHREQGNIAGFWLDAGNDRRVCPQAPAPFAGVSTQQDDVQPTQAIPDRRCFGFRRKGRCGGLD